MTDQEALLSAIRADPDDDVVRLVYADWLQERDGTEPCVHVGERACVNCRETRPGFVIGGDGRATAMCRECYDAGVRWGQIRRYVRGGNHRHVICHRCMDEGACPNRYAERASVIRSSVALARRPPCERGRKRGCKSHRSPCRPCLEADKLDKELAKTLPYTEMIVAGRSTGLLDEDVWSQDYRDDTPYFFSRGFIERVRCEWAVWEACHEAILGSPFVVLRRVELTTWPERNQNGQFETLDGWIFGREDNESDDENAATEYLRFLFPGHCPNHLVEWVLPLD